MGRLFLVELEGNSFRCLECDCPLVHFHDVLSRAFSCQQGRAFLFRNVVNVYLGPEEEKMMLSGKHTVQEVYCCGCSYFLGWKYVKAHDKTQINKEGNYLLERWRITEQYCLNSSQSGSSDQ